MHLILPMRWIEGWYPIYVGILDGTCFPKGIIYKEPLGMDDDDFPWWHCDPDGSMDDKFNLELVLDLGIKASIHICLAQRHDVA